MSCRAVGRDELWAVSDSPELVLRRHDDAWQPVPGTPRGLASDLTTLPDGRPLLVGSRSAGPYQADNVAASGDY